MEELLNKLIEKGWKPRWENVELYWVSKNTFWERIVIFIGNAGWFKKWWCTYRELVSKESGLWQFVCEKELVYRIWHDEKTYKKRKNDDWETKFAYSSDYWIIQSSLCEEENLEQFLLDNIKV